MLAQHGSKARLLVSLLAAAAAIALLVLMTPELLAQVPDASQPAGKNFLVSAPQDAKLPAKDAPVTRPQAEITVLTPAPLAPSFSTGIYPSGGEYASVVVAGDLNGDGWPDLIVANDCYRFFMTCAWDGGSVSVLMGYGGGGFSGPTSYGTVGSYPNRLAVIDINHDGKLDVMVTNGCPFGGYCLSPGELLGNGDGTLQPIQPYNDNWVWDSPGGSAMDDINGDGIPDLITLGDSTVNVQLGNSDGTFQPAISFNSGGVGAGSVAVADVNLDGKPDLLVANACADEEACRHSWSGTVGVLFNSTPYTATATKLASSSNPSTGGQAVTFTATVTPYAGTLSDGEMIAFKNGDTVLGTAPINAGIASLTTSALPAGTLKITASYAFDGIYGASAAELSQVVKAVSGFGTVLSLSASPNPATVHQAVEFTAVLTSAHGTIPDGEVITFYDRRIAVGTGVTTGGVARFVTSSLPANAYAIQAIYPGDATFKSSSRLVHEVVNGYHSTIFWFISPNPSTYGQAVTFNVNVVPDGQPPMMIPTMSGTVKFVWDRFTIGSAIVTNVPYWGGFAVFSKSTLNAGSFPMMVVYSGDGEIAGSNSEVINLVVQQATSTATLTSSTNPSVPGQAVTFSAQITSPTVVASGPVTFTAGKTVLGTAQLRGARATLTTSSLPTGTTSVTVTYEGDSNIARSTASVGQVVQ